MKKNTITLSDEQKELSKRLTPLQYRFVVNLFGGMSQRKAIKEAGSKAKTDNSLDNVATQTFSRLEVKALYDSLMQTKLTDSILKREEALVILSNNARVSISDIAVFSFVSVGVDDKGQPVMGTVWKMKDSEDIDPSVISCIKSVTMTANGPKIELHDQQNAIKQISTMEGWEAATKTDHTSSDGSMTPTFTKEDRIRARDEMEKHFGGLD